MNFLIVKTSSLGDIIQAFDSLHYLHSKFPSAAIDWAVEARFASLVAAHPLIRQMIPFDSKIKGRFFEGLFWRSQWRALSNLRKCRYDAVFDLQGNCKSGVITMLSRGIDKVGFGKNSVREWPNLLSTRTRFEIRPSLNIRMQYISLIQQFLQDQGPVEAEKVRLKIPECEKKRIRDLLSLSSLNKKPRVMVCPGSKWANKRLPLETLIDFLDKIQKTLACSFLLMWGEENEREMCLAIYRRFPRFSAVIDRLDAPVWQNLMCESDLIIAVDSAALHLTGTTPTPSFSIFGPTMPEIFKPEGFNHCAYRGECPEHRFFDKQCPLLRSCGSGACIRNLAAQNLFDHFREWWTTLANNSDLKNEKT